MIKIFAMGKIKDKNISVLIDELRKRVKIEIIELKDEKVTSNKNVKDLEAEKILEKIKNEYVIACDEHGKEFTSIDFAKLIKKEEMGKDIVFIVGGALGLSKKILDRANLVMAFSKLTFPHQLFRLFLVEQIYRVYAINKGIKYHKD